MTEPIQLKNELFENPKSEPQFKVYISDLEGKKIPLADPKSTRALVSLMNMNAVLGGAACHYGGPAAFAELMSALHGFIFEESHKANQPWYTRFHLINDAGHCENGLYALKANYGVADLTLSSLKKFRSISSPLTGHGEAHLFPEGVLLSNGPLGSALPQAQGLALGEALSKKNKVTYVAISDGACMEGEAKEALAAIPGLAKKGKMGPFVMIISDNNTKLTGRIDEDSFSMSPTFSSLSALGWEVLSLEDGHDLQKCYQIIELATSKARQNPFVPLAIHAKTIKGVGTKKTASSSNGAHGFPLKSPTELKSFISEIYENQTFPQDFQQWIDELIELEVEIKKTMTKETGEKIQNGVSAAMIRARKEGLPVISVTSDLPGSTGVAGFRKEFPEDSIDVGVAESNMISTAAGLSKVGYIPIVDTFAQFGVTKGALPLTMASLSKAPLIAIFSHTGFQDAADGASHQALSYLAMLGSIPHVNCYALTCSEEAEHLVYQAIEKFARQRQLGETPDSFIFFLGRENFPKKFMNSPSYKLNSAQILFDNSNQYKDCVCLAVSGSLISQGLRAAETLEKEGLGVILINPSMLNNIDLPLFEQSLKKSKGRMVTVEDHQIKFGLGQFIAHQLVTNNIPSQIKSLGVNSTFGQSAYSAQELYKKHHIDSTAIVKAALQFKSL